MARPKAKAPARRYHISGQSVATIGGKDYYLGKHDSPESIARYAVLIGIYQSGGFKLPADFDPEELGSRAAMLLGMSGAPAQQSNQPIKVPHWFPYQLRHLTATVIRAALGIEESQALLGHSTALMTAHYARESIEAASGARVEHG
ncbi:MAG: hypothetical protein ABI557_11880 [Aureliella sp.]